MTVGRSTPNTRGDLLAALFAIFPAFEAEWQADIEDDPFPGDSLHDVYLSFLSWLAGSPRSMEQLRLLGTLINEAVAAGGDRENAVATCLLEHLHQVGMEKQLRPWLSVDARQRLRA